MPVGMFFIENYKVFEDCICCSAWCVLLLGVKSCSFAFVFAVESRGLGLVLVMNANSSGMAIAVETHDVGKVLATRTLGANIGFAV